MHNRLKRGVLLTLVVALMVSVPSYGQSFAISAEDKSIDFSYLRGMMELIQTHYVDEVDAADLVEGAYKGMFDVLDRHSVYLPPVEYEEFNNSLEGDFSGIGVQITRDGDYIGIISPIEGTPAYDAGMKTNDVIVSVDGEDIKGWSMEKAIANIRGEEGTTVIIGIRRLGVVEVLEFPITRETIDIRHVKYEMLDKGIAYMEIETFAVDTGTEVGKGIDFFKEQNAKGMILDLRGNPGGSLEEALIISDYFLKKDEPIVFIDYRSQKDVEYLAKTDALDMPLVVLVDEGSASASEIVAGAVQDNAAGKIVGTTSYGKGTVQNLMNLTNGAGIKITVAEYFSPLRKKINTIGITPDIMVENIRADVDYDQFAPMIEGGTHKPGQKGLDIYGGQQRLKFLGYKVTTDGFFGKATEDALKSFQKGQGLEVTGLLDFETKQRIKEKVRDYIITGEEDFQLEEAKDIIGKMAIK